MDASDVRHTTQQQTGPSACITLACDFSTARTGVLARCSMSAASHLWCWQTGCCRGSPGSGPAAGAPAGICQEGMS